jgi:hypothetical protein
VFAAGTWYAASGRLIHFNSNPPTGSTSTTFSTDQHSLADLARTLGEIKD